MDGDVAVELEQLIGSWRRFGAFGPVYEIIGAAEALSNGGRAMKVRLLESGEELLYWVDEITVDPAAY